jgi:PKD domain
VRRLARRASLPAGVAPAAGAQESAAPMPGMPPENGAMPGPARSLVLPDLPFPPAVSLQPVPAYGPAPLTVGFYVNAVDPQNVGFVSYQWNFGDGHVSTLPPLYVYEIYKNPGSYLVSVTAVTGDGRSATAFAGITVRPPPR